MIKVSDYIVNRLVDYGVKDVFMISGGGAMHLNDSVGRNKSIRYICNHHEQASAIAAEGYARASGKLAVVIVTSGPGGTNTITGVIGQWLDSVPVLYISGQVKRETTIASCPHIPLRQLGDQEINIVDIVRPITKFAQQITDPRDTGRLLEEAIYVATSGRPGPVWLDIPLDVQGAIVEEDDMMPYSHQLSEDNTDTLRRYIDSVIERLQMSQRPAIIAGHGIRIAGAVDTFLNLIDRTGIPVLSSLNGCDLISTAHPCLVGRIGTIGSRAGNFALQNADLVLSIGSRNNIRQVGYSWVDFAPKAYKVVVDIDKAELLKPTVKPDLAVCADAGDFIQALIENLDGKMLPDWSGWKDWCIQRKNKYPTLPPEYSCEHTHVNPYIFVKSLCRVMPGDAVVVTGNGTTCICMFQASELKQEQRIIWNSGCASMGYDLPAAIGACFGSNKRPVICLAGDGSLQMNIQELQTVMHYNLPLKIFVLNNDGYISIRQTQENLFDGHYVACDAEHGVSFPALRKIADAYGLSYVLIDHHADMEHKLTSILETQSPVICEVVLDREYKFIPKSASKKMPDGSIKSRPLEDMAPFLDPEELAWNIIDGI